MLSIKPIRWTRKGYAGYCNFATGFVNHIIISHTSSRISVNTVRKYCVPSTKKCHKCTIFKYPMESTLQYAATK